MEIDNCTDEDLGVFMADKQCEEMEQMKKIVGYFLVVITISVPIIVVYVFLV
jgi:hypothetical protein